MSTPFNVDELVQSHLATYNDAEFNKFYASQLMLWTPGTCETARTTLSFCLHGITFSNAPSGDLTLSFKPRDAVLAIYIFVVGFFEVQCCGPYYQWPIPVLINGRQFKLPTCFSWYCVPDFNEPVAHDWTALCDATRSALQVTSAADEATDDKTLSIVFAPSLLSTKERNLVLRQNGIALLQLCEFSFISKL